MRKALRGEVYQWDDLLPGREYVEAVLGFFVLHPSRGIQMSTQQPEALRLAEFLDGLDVRTPERIQNCVSAAAELRRLHREVEEISSENMMLGNHNKNLHDHVDQLRRMLEQKRAVNAQLLEALDYLAAWYDGDVGTHMDEPHAAAVARDAIAAAKENT